MKKTILALTPLQLQALWRLIDFANHDGDAYDWFKSANATPAELRAIRQAMELVGKARHLSKSPLDSTDKPL